jgi:hypothetical protein
VTGYTKLFASILTSTIWREPGPTKLCWITMLAMSDQDGIVESSIPGLAHLAGVSIQEAEIAIATFLAPDQYSRSPEFEGRRIEPVDGDWRILNRDKYRDKMSPADVRERSRIRQQRFRDRHNVTSKRYASVTQRDKTSDVTRVTTDKGRDRDREKSKASCAEPLQAHAPEAGVADALFRLPLNDKSFFEVGSAQVEHCRKLYPAVDVEQQFRNMLGWLEANPTKRKTRRGVEKFIHSWLSREQDKPRNNGGTNGNQRGIFDYALSRDRTPETKIERVARQLNDEAAGKLAG